MLATDVLASADHVSAGLEAGPIRYVAALFIVVSGVLGVLYVRSMSKRVEEAQSIGASLERLARLGTVLEQAIAFVVAQQPRKRGSVAPVSESNSGVHPVAKP